MPDSPAKADEPQTIPSRTEDRVDLADLGEDLPHSLPGMRPSRFEELTRQERSAYRNLLVPLRKLRRATFRLLKLRDAKAYPRRKVIDWDAFTQTDWDRAMKDFLGEMQGSDSIATATAGWRYSDAALPTEWRLGTSIGIDRATLLTGATEAATAEVNERFVRSFGEHAFDRLSDQGRSRLGMMLDGDQVPGGSVRSIIEGAVSSGENPLETARLLSERFDQYERWEFTRLTRTEVAFAQEAGIREELTGEGFREVAGAEYPPFHPNCVCSQEVDMDSGLILPSVSPSACEVCQAALLGAVALAPEAERGRPFAGPAVEPELQPPGLAPEAMPYLNVDYAALTPELISDVDSTLVNFAAKCPEVAKSIENVKVIPAPISHQQAICWEDSPWVRNYWQEIEGKKVWLADVNLNQAHWAKGSTPRIPVSSVAKTPDELVTHELGHVTFYWAEDPGKLANEMLELVSDPRFDLGYVSDYGRINESEKFAEAFIQVLHRPSGDWSEPAKAVAEFLTKHGVLR